MPLTLRWSIVQAVDVQAHGRTPRIALVRAAFNPAGGAERFVTRIAAALAARGAEVTLIVRRWPRSADAGLPPQARLIELRPFYMNRAQRDATFAAAVRDAVSKEAFDLVQSHERIPGMSLYRAGDGVHKEWLALREKRYGPLRGAIDRLSGSHRATLRAEREMFTHPNLQCVVCNSDMVRQDILRHYAVDPGKLVVIRNGIDLRQFSPPSPGQRVIARLGLSWPAEKFIFLFVGSGFERKGLETAIRALADARLKSKCMLMVVGHDKNRARYARMAQSLGIKSEVHFLGAQQEVLRYYHAADALVLPTLYDPQSNAVLEAMACALPVITSTTSGAAEVLLPGAGFVVDSLDHRGWADAMFALAGSDRARTMGLLGRRAIESHSIDSMCTDYLALYARLINQTDDLAP